jgi:hypothetical protein
MLSEEATNTNFIVFGLTRQVMNMIFFWIFHNSLNNEEEGSFYVIDYKEEHVIVLLFCFLLCILCLVIVWPIWWNFVNSWIITQNWINNMIDINSNKIMFKKFQIKNQLKNIVNGMV